MQIRPLYDRVIVKRIEKPHTTAAGIVIPDAAAENPEQGEVLAVGQGRLMRDGKLRPLAVRPGDQVLFGKYGGQSVKLAGDELLVLREEDLLAVIEAGPGEFKQAA